MISHFVCVCCQTVFVIVLCNNQLIEQLESSLRKLFQNTPAVSHVLNRILLQLQKARQNYDNKLDTNKVSLTLTEAHKKTVPTYS